MGKLTLAGKLADELAVSTGKAKRAVDDLGADNVRRLLDDVQQNGSSRLPSGWRKGVLATGAVSGAAGGGALAWRQQDVWQAQAAAREAQARTARSENYAEAMKWIVESDLPADLKRQFAKGASATANSPNNGSGDNSGDGGLVPDDPQTLIILIIVLALVLKYALESGRLG
jgi:hypothetical protein